MSSIAAILVLVACPANQAHCISEPLRVVSFQHVSECKTSLPLEIKQAEHLGIDVIGECHTVDAHLLKNRKPINLVAGLELAGPEDNQDRSSEAALGYFETGEH